MYFYNPTIFALSALFFTIGSSLVYYAIFFLTIMGMFWVVLKVWQPIKRIIDFGI